MLPTIEATLRELIGIDFFATVVGVGLDNTQVTEVLPLEDLTQLAVLGLPNTQISDLSSLSKLTHLSDLDLAGTQVTDWRCHWLLPRPARYTPPMSPPNRMKGQPQTV